MKTLPLLILTAHCCLAAEPSTDPPARLAPLREAATVFCRTIETQDSEGLPSAENLQQLAPLMTPQLHSVMQQAKADQARQMKRHPDEKPDWIEGDLFSSLFEGVSHWELDEAFYAPGSNATVKVKLTYTEPRQPAVNWTDTLVFKQSGTRWLLDDIRMGGEWAFKSGDTLRGRLPGGGKETGDHQSLDEKWQVKFENEGGAVTKITARPTDAPSQPQALFGANPDESCPFPTWVVWSPDCRRLAIRLGDGPRFTRTLVYQLEGKHWKAVALPDFYPQEKKTMAANGFRERDRLIDADYWQDANTLAVRYFGNWTKADEGDGFAKRISVRMEAHGRARTVEAVDLLPEE